MVPAANQEETLEETCQTQDVEESNEGDEGLRSGEQSGSEEGEVKEVERD